MIEPNEVQAKLMEHLVQHSGLEPHRNYLGMSAIGQCPRKLYFDFVVGRTLTERDHLMCYAGYLFEGDALARLAAAGICRVEDRRELVAPFDARFRGHTDGQTFDGELLEIKSVNAKIFERLRVDQRAKMDHFLQVQTYMRYGPWRKALVVYVSRETFEHLILPVAKNERYGQQMEGKAKRILGLIDAHTPPECECGFCKQ